MPIHPQSKLSITPAKLTVQGKVPMFYLPSTAGRQSGPAATRSKYNLVLLFQEDSEAGENYLRALSELHPAILESEARLMVVVPLSLENAQTSATRLNLPFTLLADEGGETTRRMLGEGKQAALCVADRYGVVYYLETVQYTTNLPSARTALDRLEFIEIQCPE
jgi:peroxiredoxin